MANKSALYAPVMSKANITSPLQKKIVEMGKKAAIAWTYDAAWAYHVYWLLSLESRYTE